MPQPGKSVGSGNFVQPAAGGGYLVYVGWREVARCGSYQAAEQRLREEVEGRGRIIEIGASKP